MFRLSRTVQHVFGTALGALAGIVSGCGSSKIVTQWQDSQITGPLLRDVLVIAVRNDPVRRRVWFATALAKRGAKATAHKPGSAVRA